MSRSRRARGSWPARWCGSLAAAVAAAVAAGGVAAAPAGAVFEPSGVSGGGFQNVIAVASAQTAATVQGRVIVGADVAGFHLSDDQGATWRPSNTGINEALRSQAW